MAEKRKRSSSSFTKSDVFESAPIEDRSSKFIAFFSPTLSAHELQSQHKVSTAMHKMVAWRQVSSQRAFDSKPVIEVGHDDDGEKHGGKTLEKVLSYAHIEGTIVVARWYGGVLLGSVRFDHIRNCALEAIADWRESTSKKRKVQEEKDAKERLLEELPKRDHSIIVLRELLATKTESNSSNPKPKVSPAKIPNYEALPLPALQKLESVRDATIEWLLKGIDKAEEKAMEPTQSDQLVKTCDANDALPQSKPS